MKSLRQTCAVAVLSMALAISAFAGTIDSPGVASPPPPSETSTTSGSAVAGQIGSPGAASPAPEGTSASSITTTVILTILSLVR